MRQRALEYNAHRLADDALIDALAEPLRRISCPTAARVALLGGEDRGPEPRCLNAPVMLSSEYVHRITRGECRKRRQPAINQPADGLDALRGAGNLPETPR